MGIGKNLKILMESKGINAHELAQAVGVTPSTIYSMLDRDSKKISIDLLIKIAHALGISADELLTGKIETPAEENKDAEIEKIIRAYKKASPDTQKAVKDILHIREDAALFSSRKEA